MKTVLFIILILAYIGLVLLGFYLIASQETWIDTLTGGLLIGFFGRELFNLLR